MKVMVIQLFNTLRLEVDATIVSRIMLENKTHFGARVRSVISVINRPNVGVRLIDLTRM